MASQVLTERQRKVLDYIRSTIETQGYPPTLREIGSYMGIRSTNGVNDHLRALERKGYLRRDDMKSRALRPTDLAFKELGFDGPMLRGVTSIHAGAMQGGAMQQSGAMQAAGGMTSVQISAAPAFEVANDNLVEIQILGRVAAGLPMEAIQEPIDTVRVDRMLVGGARDVFGLRITGESMIDAGIHDGDYVFVRKQLDAQRGDIVVALVGEEATCKYYYPEREHIRLQPANKSMAPILIPKTEWRSTKILGVVVGMYRKLSS